jgi:CubicO group peptidase (beta-lactamase class C family)
LLAWIIERITGLTYSQALQHLIWDNLALADESAICVNGSGAAVAHGGLILTTDDLARFGTLFTRASPPTKHSLTVPASYLAMLRTPRTDVVARTGLWPPMAHSAGQWNLIYSDGDLYKSGFGGQGLYISPRQDVVIAFCGIPDSQSRTHRLAERCRDLTQQWPSDASTDP